jgi:hypothetical protein
MQDRLDNDDHARSDSTAAREAWDQEDSFLSGAVHSMTHTVPRSGLQARLVPWTLALVMIAGVALSAIGVVTTTY